MIKDIRELLICLALGALLLFVADIQHRLRKLQGDVTEILKVAEMYEK